MTRIEKIAIIATIILTVVVPVKLSTSLNYDFLGLIIGLSFITAFIAILISIIRKSWKGERFPKAELIEWSTLCAIILVISLIQFDGKPNSDVHDFQIWAMIGLTFPSGLLIIMAYGWINMFLYQQYSYVQDTSYCTLIITWLIIYFTGLLQWFILLPFIIRKFFRRTDDKIN